MMNSAHHLGPRPDAATTSVGSADDTLCERLRGEYLEMPGLRLTVAQAARLLNLDADHCSAVLHALVRSGALWTNGREFLSRNVGSHCN